METLVEAISRLSERGYTAQFRSDDGELRCDRCDRSIDPAAATIDETVRFEGDSNPDDEAILFALTPDCGHRGIFTSGYGPSMPQSDIEIIARLRTAGS